MLNLNFKTRGVGGILSEGWGGVGRNNPQSQIYFQTQLHTITTTNNLKFLPETTQLSKIIFVSYSVH